jgi:DNA polymerase sigma
MKKKHKEFFLFPIEHNKKKKEKKTKIKQGENNPPKKINTKSESENENDDKSTQAFSHSTTTEINTSERIEFNGIYNNNINKNNNDFNNNNKINSNIKNYNNKNKINNDILIETKVSKIEFTCKKSMDEEIGNENKIKENRINDIIDEKNKMEYLSKFDKCQSMNSNNPVINNYFILGKESFYNNTTYVGNFEQKINNNIFVQAQNPIFSPNYYAPTPLPTFNYPNSYQQIQSYYMDESFIELSNEIIAYEKIVYNNLEILKKYREQILNKIKDYIKEIMEENNFICELINYGSYETELNIEISDIDVLIKFYKKNSNNIIFENQYQVLSLIYNELNKKKEDYNILSLNAIYTASVPVLKIKCNLENIIPEQKIKEIKNNCGLNIEEEILQLNFDFTFTEVNNLNEPIMIPSLEIVSYIKKAMSNYKEIKPLILLLKRYMKINKLNSSYTGGLSSYSLFLLVYAFFKSMICSQNNLGQYFLEFLEFYSNFNFGIYSINVNLNNPFILLNELHECGMMLIDPITNLNVAKSTFKVDQIKSVLTKGVVNIRNAIYQKINENNKNNININKTCFLEELFKNRKNRVPIINPINPM